MSKKSRYKRKIWRALPYKASPFKEATCHVRQDRRINIATDDYYFKYAQRVDPTLTRIRFKSKQICRTISLDMEQYTKDKVMNFAMHYGVSAKKLSDFMYMDEHKWAIGQRT